MQPVNLINTVNAKAYSLFNFINTTIIYKRGLTLTAVAGELYIRARVLPILQNIKTNNPKSMKNRKAVVTNPTQSLKDSLKEDKPWRDQGLP